MKMGRLKGTLILLCLISAFSSFPPALAQSSSSSSNSSSADLLEAGRGAQLQKPPASPSAIKIISYNIRWRSGEEIREIIELLRSDAELGRASIIGLQEADRNKKRSGYTNTARVMANELGMYYAWAAPPLSDRSREREEETGVAILSAYPMTEISRLVLPNEGPGGRRRVAVGATIQIGPRLIRVYSVHGETRIPVQKKLEQLEAVVEDLKSYPKATGAIVLGDFNTLEQQAIENTTQLFTESGFETPFPNSLKTWKTFIIELKLDWIWLKGLRPSDYGVDRQVRFSDHFPLWVKINLDGKAPGKPDIRGRIEKINPVKSATGNRETIGTLLIEGGKDDKPRFDKAVVRVTTETRINLLRGQELTSLSFGELKKGDRVEARFVPGPVLMSYPVQATAAEITVTR